MNRGEIIKEIERVEAAIYKTQSYKLRNDYGKYLRRLKRELRNYDRLTNGARNGTNGCQ